MAELHVHLEGAADRALLRRVAADSRWRGQGRVFRDGPRRSWRTFEEFLHAYDDAAKAFRTTGSYRTLTAWYLGSLAAQGAIYAELTVSPQHAEVNGLKLEQLLAGVAAGIGDAHAEHGIEARILVTALRHVAPAAGLRMIQEVVELAHPLVTGFGLAGDESIPPGEFGHAFEVASAAGMGCTVHAGEFRGAASVREALALPIERIGHGVRAVEDPALLTELRDRDITLECCPSSNVVLGVVASWPEHPLRQLVDAGVRVTLSTDDPPYFGCTLAGEYALAGRHHGFGPSELLRFTRNALEAAFVDEDTRTRLLARCDALSVPRQRS